MLISKMLKNVVLNYSCSLGLFLLLLGTVFLNSNYKSKPEMRSVSEPPGKQDVVSVTCGLERKWGSTKGTEIDLEPFPTAPAVFSYVWVFFNVIMW